ncbi:putative mfs sugar transporter [Erysiphe neolycopersici]|uniref:Putative mfs sugar transporter n=1 Tax=Erysiphe neolycopersici TaxID=212602 RepID=A0A420H972_9PEZI|nr:putative mfs sugar transporter [Erysiphe neolycopersici]
MMSSYFSALLTTTTARVASLRQNLLSTEDDGETEDDTHLCRVLRSYYTENDRPFPAWLPSDPKTAQSTISQSTNVQSNIGSKYGGIASQNTTSTSFASLFSAGNEQSNPQETSNLRQGRRQPRMRQEPTSSDKTNMQDTGNSGMDSSKVRSRPLPSAMAGSYQTANMGLKGNNQSSQSQINLGGRPMSAKDRLKSGKFRRPEPRLSGSAESNNYNNSSSDRSDKPFVAATSPWANNELEFRGAGYNPPPKSKPLGLPSGPASGRRIGLPSGPRGQR